MTSFRTLIAAAALVGAVAGASSATAQVTTYTTQTGFAAATTGDTTYGFPFTTQTATGTSYAMGPATFSSSALLGYNDAYGMPYISANNRGSESATTFTISSTTSALGLILGSYYGASSYSYVVNGVGGSIAVPLHDSTTFLGFSNASGPVSVTFNIASGTGAGVELDVPQFITGSTGAVPEPATWGMMIVGMGCVGFAMRRRVRRSDKKFDARIKAIAAGEIA